MADPNSLSTMLEPPWLVVVGASGADGFRQLVDFVAALPPDLPAAVALVLHRPADKPSHMPEILRRAGRLPVVAPADGERMAAGHCYVADATHHLSVGPQGTVRLEADHSYRNRTIDLLFTTAAAESGMRTVGVVLAGELKDGSRGLAAIAAAGGYALVIDSVWTAREGMPRAASLAVPTAARQPSAAGLAAEVTDIVRRVTRQASASPPSAEDLATAFDGDQ